MSSVRITVNVNDRIITVKDAKANHSTRHVTFDTTMEWKNGTFIKSWMAYSDLNQHPDAIHEFIRLNPQFKHWVQLYEAYTEPINVQLDDTDDEDWDQYLANLEVQSFGP